MTASSPLRPARPPSEARLRPYRLKRAFDVALAVLALPFAGIALLPLALLVRLTTPGPALFRQVRIGRDERPFVCLKLRTMWSGTGDLPTHEAGAAMVTPVGRVLRASKLDELPQLWNILRGEMSFVGPRPCLPTQTALIAARRRYGLAPLRPGITGVAQVAGVDMRDPERLAALDAAYPGVMSLRADLALLARTVLGAGRGDRIAARK